MKSIFRSLIVFAGIGFVSQAHAVSCQDEYRRAERDCLTLSGPPDMKREFRVVRYFNGGFDSECTIIWNGAVDVFKATLYCDGSVPGPQPTPTPTPTPQPTPAPNPDPNPAPPPVTITKPSRDNVACEKGSIILTDNQVLGETIPIVGANFQLAYFTNKINARTGDYTLQIPLTAAIYDSKFTQVKYSIKINGILVESKTLAIGKNLSADFFWNGQISGNNNIGSGLAQVTVEKIPGGKPSTYSVPIGSFQAKYVGLGGWVPTVYHYYDIARKQVLRGDGSSFSATPDYQDENIMRIADMERSLVYVFNSKTGKHKNTMSFIRPRDLFVFEYDSNGFLTGITELFKVKTIFNRNSTGDLISITAPTGEVTQITLDANKFLSSAISPANQTYSATYNDSNGLLKSFKKPQGQVSTFSYDNYGNLLLDGHSGGYSVSIDKVTSGTKTFVSTKTQMGRVNQYSGEDGVDKDGPFYERIERRFDGTFKQVFTSADFNISFTRDQSNNGKFVSDVSRTKSSPRFKNANSFWYKVVSGTVTYNSLVRNEEWQLADSEAPFSIVSFSITDSFNGNKTITKFDSETDTYTTKNPRGSTVITKVDEWERPVSMKFGNDVPSMFAYAKEKLTRISRGSRFVDYTYDPITKRLVNAKNALGQTTSYTYDKAGRLESTAYADGKKILFNYDENDKLIAITPADRPKHNFIFNSLELLTGYNPPSLTNDGTTPTQYLYNEDKQLVSLVKPDGKTITYNYDSKKGTLTTVTAPEGTYSYKFNAVHGQFDSVVTPSNLETQKIRIEDGFLQFDVLRNAGPFLGFYHALPDAQGRVRRDRISGLDKTPDIFLEYSYGVDEKLEKIGDEVISYDVVSGRISGTKTNSVTDSYQYNEYGELSAYVAKFGNTILYSLTLAYDNLGRIIKKVEAVKGSSLTYEYVYDLRGRLVEVKQNGAVKSKYSYDANDNRIAGTVDGQAIKASYDAQDRLVAYNSETFQYNPNGELISRKNANTNQVVPYAFDSFAKMTSVQVGSNVHSYQMDGAGRRAINSVNGKVQSTYIYKDQIRLAGVIGDNGVALQFFGYGTKFHVPDLMIMNGSTYRIITDHLGSVRLVVKATDGTVVQEMLHDEFGRVVKNTAPGFQPFGFAGGLFDHNTNLVQFGARWYDPQVGRWMSKDPILFAGGSGNLYGYVSNDPVNFIDPTGLTQADIDKALSIVSGVYPVIKQTPISYRKFMDDTSALAEINLFAKNRLIIDSDNLKELNEHQKTELLNTLFHEAKHLNDGYPGHMLDFWSPKDKDGLSSYHKSIYLKSSELTTKYNQCN